MKVHRWPRKDTHCQLKSTLTPVASALCSPLSLTLLTWSWLVGAADTRGHTPGYQEAEGALPYVFS